MSTASPGETLVRRVFDEVFNQRALDVCDEIVAVDYVEHAVVRDDLSTMLRLGVIPRPGPPG
jgi:hypothetical protein